MITEFAQKAKALIPTLTEEKRYPKAVVEIKEKSDDFFGVGCDEVCTADELKKRELRCGDSFILDFGQYVVGTLSIKFRMLSRQQDSPLRLRLSFGETPRELYDILKGEYHGGLSSSWLQDEYVYIDCAEQLYTLSRRYSFRYLRVEFAFKNAPYVMALDDIFATFVSSADGKKCEEYDFGDELLNKIDAVSCHTLKCCMQDVFEDGPKRDRRLWLGDLHLQALANYETFKNYDLVKRCLYLFAALPGDDGLLSCCVFREPVMANDHWRLFDYALFFISCLDEYYAYTDDLSFVSEMWDVAKKQAELVMEKVESDGLVHDVDVFVDWAKGLDKQVCRQAITVYTLKNALSLCNILGDGEFGERVKSAIKTISDSTVSLLFDEKSGVFVSGENRQVSIASQVWATLAGIINGKEAARAIENAENQGTVSMVTPYMHHFYTEALIICGEKDKALRHIKDYWGSMVKNGADCFWEAYDESNSKLSPYGDVSINSHCHAWSCTAGFLLRKYYR